MLMRLDLWGAMAASLALSVQPALAGNFEFAVPAPMNLMLTISGHDASGAQLFSQTVNQVEMRGSQPHYVIRIDETVVAGKLSRWCAMDRTGTWAELPGSHACIDRPVESRGIYTFDTALAKAVAAPTEPAEPAGPAPVALTVEEMTSCVQAGLNTLGFDAGAVDGQLGNGTRRAFTAYVATTDGKISDRWQLNERTMGAFCIYLARDHELDAGTEALAARHAAAAQLNLPLAVPRDSVKAVAMVDDKNSALARLETFEDYVNPADGRQMLGVTFPYNDVAGAQGVCVYAADGWVIRDKAGKGYLGSCHRLDPALSSAGPLIMSYVVERGEPG